MPSSRKSKAGQWGLSGNALKYIAMFSMLADHIGLVILEWTLYYRGSMGRVAWIMVSEWWDVLYRISRVLRMAGRLAFPIYCFLLVEGFLHTGSWKKYWLRLAAFALISEIPFSLAVWNAWPGGSRNVFLELAIGLLVLRGLKGCEGLWAPRGFRERPGLLHVSRLAAMAAVIGTGCVLACVWKTDYDMDGILIISAYYLLRKRRGAQAVAGGGLCFLNSWERNHGAGALAAVPVLLYNGKKGKDGWKYLFYWFYPVHLMVLFLIRRFIIGIPLG